MDELEFEFPERNFASIIVSKRASGKSFLCNYLIKNFHDNKRFDYYIVFSQTSHLSNDFSCIPKKQHFKVFNEEIINKVFNFQEKYRKTKKPKNCCIIIDDCIGGIGNEFKILLDKLYSLGRHYLCSIITLSQIGKNVITPTMRNNVDIWMFSINNRNTMDVIYENVIWQGNRQSFYKFVQENTTNYRFIIYDNTKSTSNDYYIIKAEDPGEFNIKNIKR